MRKTLALLVRALRVDARNLGPHLMRFALVGIVLFILLVSSTHNWRVNAPGLSLLNAIVVTNIAFCFLVGVPYFSSAIAEEKETRTLGLLKMADIGALSVILGKWLPRVIGMLSLLAVQFPFTMLAITLGGVTFRQTTATYLALLVYLIWIGAVSLFASVVCRTTASACRLAFILLIARAYLPSLLLPMVRQTFDNRLIGLVEFWGNASVSAHVERALSVSFQESVWPATLAWMTIESALFFGLAWLVFEPFTRSEAGEVRAANWWPTRRSSGPRRRAWEAALVGKDFHQMGGGWRWSVIRYGLYLLSVVVLCVSASSSSGFFELRFLGYYSISIAIPLLVLELVLASARVFRKELSEQTWSSLVILPRTLPEVIWPKIAGSLLGCWPALALLAQGCILAPGTVFDFFEFMFSDMSALLAMVYILQQSTIILLITMLCSITMSWAAWPMAAPIAGFVVGFSNLVVFASLAACLASSNESVVMLSFLNIVAGVAIVLLSQAIRHHLTLKASDGA